MDRFEFTLFPFGFSADGIYAVTLAALIAVLVIVLTLGDVHKR
jgi:hypothetical protein